MADNITQAQIDVQVATAVAAATATAKAEGVTEGILTGAAAERTRFAAIVGSDTAKTRPSAAIKLATNEKLSALDAGAINDLLADMPEEKPVAAAPGTGGAPKGMLKAAMAGTEQPGIEAAVGDDDEDDDDAKAEKTKSFNKVNGALSMTKGDVKASA